MTQKGSKNTKRGGLTTMIKLNVERKSKIRFYQLINKMKEKYDIEIEVMPASQIAREYEGENVAVHIVEKQLVETVEFIAISEELLDNAKNNNFGIQEENIIGDMIKEKVGVCNRYLMFKFVLLHEIGHSQHYRELGYETFNEETNIAEFEMNLKYEKTISKYDEYQNVSSHEEEREVFNKYRYEIEMKLGKEYRKTPLESYADEFALKHLEERV